MTLEFELDENDYLMHQLFTASNSDRIKKKRSRNRILIPFLYAFIGLMMYLDGNNIMAAGFIVFGILWFFIYPLWEKQYYRNHYLNFIRDNYKERIGQKAILNIDEEYLIGKNDGIESKISKSELNGINEIADHIFIRLKGGQSIIIPKNKIDDLESLKSKLRELSSDLKINYLIDENWEWK